MKIKYNEIIGDELLKIVKSHKLVMCIIAVISNGSGLWCICNAARLDIDVGI